MFFKKMQNCDNTVVRSISMHTCIGNCKIMSKYSIHSLHLHSATIKQIMWRQHFVDTSIANGKFPVFNISCMSMFCVCVHNFSLTLDWCDSGLFAIIATLLMLPSNQC